MRTVKVPLGDRSYPIIIGAGVLPKLGGECSRRSFSTRCAVISDRNVAALYGRGVLESLARAGFNPLLVQVAPGESAKCLKVVQSCCDRLAAHRLERGSFVVALGGGVVGDLAGFVAASYLRGIALVQVPTTLLAQVDSSVGGKVGVNLRAGKNLVGAFYQPRFVLCDLQTLDTLPARQFRAGLAEVIKYGIIFDAALFDRLERDLQKILRKDRELLATVVARCCAIKSKVVGQDETEGGLRAILNFGHTIGHAIEAISGYRKYLHGEAISVGQLAAARLSSELLGFPVTEVERIRQLFTRAGLPTKIAFDATRRKQLLAAMMLDKKVRGGEVKFVLAKKIGQVEFDIRVPLPMIEAVLIREQFVRRDLPS